MKKVRITILSFFVVLLIVSVYILFIADNVFLRVANHSLNRESAMIKVWIDNELITNDSLEVDLTSKKGNLYRVRMKKSNDYVIKAQVNDDSVVEKTIGLNWFSFVYITIDDSNVSGLDEVVINNYTLREAWSMNLITGSKE